MNERSFDGADQTLRRGCHCFELKKKKRLFLIPMRRQLDQSRHCYAFEQDFIGSWRCIPLCVRRKLDLAGVKLKLSHWLAMSQEQRQALVDWNDGAQELTRMRDHLRVCTAAMADGVVKDLPPCTQEPWQQSDALPESLLEVARTRQVQLSLHHWRDLCELDRFALCKLARPGHDHHNLDAAFNEVLG